MRYYRNVSKLSEKGAVHFVFLATILLFIFLLFGCIHYLRMIGVIESDQAELRTKISSLETRIQVLELVNARLGVK